MEDFGFGQLELVGSFAVSMSGALCERKKRERLGCQGGAPAGAGGIVCRQHVGARKHKGAKEGEVGSLCGRQLGLLWSSEGVSKAYRGAAD